jgi:hypothetical protein
VNSFKLRGQLCLEGHLLGHNQQDNAAFRTPEIFHLTDGFQFADHPGVGRREVLSKRGKPDLPIDHLPEYNFGHGQDRPISAQK